MIDIWLQLVFTSSTVSCYLPACYLRHDFFYVIRNWFIELFRVGCCCCCCCGRGVANCTENEKLGPTLIYVNRFSLIVFPAFSRAVGKLNERLVNGFYAFSSNPFVLALKQRTKIDLWLLLLWMESGDYPWAHRVDTFSIIKIVILWLFAAQTSHQPVESAALENRWFASPHINGQFPVWTRFRSRTVFNGRWCDLAWPSHRCVWRCHPREIHST